MCQVRSLGSSSQCCCFLASCSERSCRCCCLNSIGSSYVMVSARRLLKTFVVGEVAGVSLVPKLVQSTNKLSAFSCILNILLSPC